ncbi:hypothetical protein BGW38_005094 [Lunasporangiospora selenospora]|uniref:Uncharacterized protein n=1 Tax=Lunasporangiospora selenospora TaxID=979761 RepID=A0A9P6KB38_9FUNG|nr:hypothetical protein BGW38_005094 [Lunasporangiospora selenospora]
MFLLDVTILVPNEVHIDRIEDMNKKSGLDNSLAGRSASRDYSPFHIMDITPDSLGLPLFIILSFRRLRFSEAYIHAYCRVFFAFVYSALVLVLPIYELAAVSRFTPDRRGGLSFEELFFCDKSRFESLNGFGPDADDHDDWNTAWISCVASQSRIIMALLMGVLFTFAELALAYAAGDFRDLQHLSGAGDGEGGMGPGRRRRKHVEEEGDFDNESPSRRAFEY